ncbi:MAG: phosphohistidine phosphatase SixA [Cyanobium sp.]
MTAAMPLVLPAAELLLLRHGIAEPRQEGRADAARALTAACRRRCAAVLERLRQRGLAADRLLSSPLVRARQTAELAVQADLAPALELAASLAPGGSPLPQLATWLASLPSQAGQRPRLLLVGHEPDLGDLASALIGAPPGAITLRKSGLALLRCGGSTSDAVNSESQNDTPERAPRRLASLRLLLTPALVVGGAET